MNYKAALVAFLLLNATNLMASGVASEEEEWEQQAQAMLLAQLGNGVSIKTELIERVTWPNGALGCPKPEMMYSQALIDGYRIVLSADGRQYAFHGSVGSKPFYCANPQSAVQQFQAQ